MYTYHENRTIFSEKYKCNLMRTSREGEREEKTALMRMIIKWQFFIVIQYGTFFENNEMKERVASILII